MVSKTQKARRGGGNVFSGVTARSVPDPDAAENAYYDAFYSDNLPGVKAALDSGARIHDKGKLIQATGYGRYDIARELISHGADVNEANNNGTTSLMAVSSNGNLAFLRDLIGHGANVNAVDKQGYGALIYAVERNSDRYPRINIIRELLSRGARMPTNIPADILAKIPPGSEVEAILKLRDIVNQIKQTPTMSNKSAKRTTINELKDYAVLPPSGDFPGGPMYLETLAKYPAVGMGKRRKTRKLKRKTGKRKSRK